MIELHGITKRFGNVATIPDLSFTARGGNILIQQTPIPGAAALLLIAVMLWISAKLLERDHVVYRN